MKTDNIQRLIANGRPIIFFDLETTGVNPMEDRIVQICAFKISPDGTTEKKTRLINPEILIPEEATEIHGITNEMVKGEPTFSQISEGLKEFMTGCHFGGYNSNRFDIPLLAMEFERSNVRDPFTGCDFIDVFHLFCQFHKRKLEDAYRAYVGDPDKEFHDACVDVQATVEVFESMIDSHPDELDNSIHEVSEYGFKFKKYDLFGKILIGEDGRKILNFGKHEGKTVKEIDQIDSGWLDWAINVADLPKNTKEKLKFLRNLKN